MRFDLGLLKARILQTSGLSCSNYKDLCLDDALTGDGCLPYKTWLTVWQTHLFFIIMWMLRSNLANGCTAFDELLRVLSWTDDDDDNHTDTENCEEGSQKFLLAGSETVNPTHYTEERDEDLYCKKSDSFDREEQRHCVEKKKEMYLLNLPPNIDRFFRDTLADNEL